MTGISATSGMFPYGLGVDLIDDLKNLRGLHFLEHGQGVTITPRPYHGFVRLQFHGIVICHLGQGFHSFDFEHISLGFNDGLECLEIFRPPELEQPFLLGLG